MAGFGFNFNSSGSMANSLPRKPMGIQFVKSTEVVGSPQNSSSIPPDDLHSSLSGGNTNSNSNAIPSLMSCQVAPCSQTNASANTGKPISSPYDQAFVKSGETYSSLKPNSFGSPGYRMPGQSNLNKGGVKGGGFAAAAPVRTFQRIAEARPVCSVEEYLRAWKLEKDPDVAKLRKLAYEVVSLKTDRPNAKDKLHSAANRVPVRIEFNTQPVFGAKNSNSFLCYVYIESVSIASGQSAKMKDAKTNAYEAALQKILTPHLRIIHVDPISKELQVSKEPFIAPPPEPSKVPLNAKQSPVSKDPTKEVPSQHKESNMEAAALKRRYNEYKPLDEFVIVEPKVPIPDCTAAHTLRRSADFNHMLLEYEYFFRGEAARCILRIENEVLADVNGISKAAAKNVASAQALLKLKKFCWIIKTKQAVDSNTKISKEEMLNELNEQSDSISHDNIGNKLLRKMGWSGGGVGKDGSGIAEPVSLKSVLNREGLGLSATKGITDEFRRKIKDVIESYAASDNQEDLVFSSDFRLEERQIVHDECRRLNLRSKSRGKGQKRYLCVRRKRSVSQLFDHLMSVGGETARYQLVPPGRDGAMRTPSSGAGNFCGSQSLPPEASPNSFVPFSDSSCANNGAIPSFMKESKQFVSQNRNSLIPNNATSAANAGVGMQAANRQGGSTPNHRGNISGFRRNNNGNNSMGNQQQGLLGNCLPAQNQFTGNIVHGDHSVQNNGSNLQSSTFVRGPVNNSMGNGPYNNRMGFNSQSQNNVDVDYRSNAPNNVAFTPQNNRGNNMMYPAQSNSPVFSPMGNSVPGSPQTGTGMMSNGFQQNNVNPCVFNQGRGVLQGHQNNMAITRMPFNNGLNGMPMGGGACNLPAPGMNQRATNPDWGDPGGHNNSGGQWGMVANGASEMNMYSNQHMQQQQGADYGSNFNPNMMGGYR